ncbi:unnamed protein product [Gadus morhua 'NCC']
MPRRAGLTIFCALGNKALGPNPGPLYYRPASHQLHCGGRDLQTCRLNTWRTFQQESQQPVSFTPVQSVKLERPHLSHALYIQACIAISSTVVEETFRPAD